jgi:hypothetical protein
MLCENTALQKSKVLKDPCFWVLNQHVSYNDPFVIDTGVEPLRGPSMRHSSQGFLHKSDLYGYMTKELGQKFKKFIVGALLPFNHHIFCAKNFFEPGLKISQRQF